MELAAWDFLNVQVTSLLARTGDYLSKLDAGGSSSSDDGNEGVTEEGGEGRIKRITTGPTEVEYFDKYSDSVVSWWRYYAQALQPGGIMDELRKNLCTLAERLEIYLPFCDPLNHPVVPKVVNRRRPGPLGGPNPSSPVKKRGLFNK